MGRRARRRPVVAEMEMETAAPAGRASRMRPMRGKRLRMGREQPGAILRGPRIAVVCQCGERRDLPYGDDWTCETCGRHWDTRQIPADQYQAIRRTQLRYRALPVALGLLVAAVAIYFSLSGNAFSVFFLLPVALTVWFVLLRPTHRKRYRAAVADLPRWSLRPD